MKITFWITLMFIACLGFGCAKEASKPANANTAASPKPASSPANTTVIPKDGNYDGKGRVTKIDMKLGSVELDHEDIPGVMPPMVMEFTVRDKKQLNGLKIDDKVDFVLEYKHPTEIIVNIKKTK